MAVFLSSEWLHDLAERLAGTTNPVRLVVEVVVRGDPETRYRVDTGPAGTEIREPSGNDDADLTLFLDAEGARCLAAGDANAQELLAAGSLKVRGDLRAILDHADALGALRGPT